MGLLGFECRLQVVSSGGGEPYLRLQKNNITYDLTKAKAVLLLSGYNELVGNARIR